MKRHKDIWEDDGRTVASMEGLERPGLLLPAGRGKGSRSGRRTQQSDGEKKPWETAAMTAAERRACILGAWKAALLIALAYIAGLGLLIALMVLWFTP